MRDYVSGFVGALVGILLWSFTFHGPDLPLPDTRPKPTAEQVLDRTRELERELNQTCNAFRQVDIIETCAFAFRRGAAASLRIEQGR